MQVCRSGSRPVVSVSRISAFKKSSSTEIRPTGSDLLVAGHHEATRPVLEAQTRPVPVGRDDYRRVPHLVDDATDSLFLALLVDHRATGDAIHVPVRYLSDQGIMDLRYWIAPWRTHTQDARSADIHERR